VGINFELSASLLSLHKHSQMNWAGQPYGLCYGSLWCTLVYWNNMLMCSQTEKLSIFCTNLCFQTHNYRSCVCGIHLSFSYSIVWLFFSGCLPILGCIWRPHFSVIAHNGLFSLTVLTSTVNLFQHVHLIKKLGF